ncbi:MAG: radical SAM protein [Thermoanaerobacteraceae bacterium]|nr:radical SAM protein [Thermoanaerobacteraceae bacterium]
MQKFDWIQVQVTSHCNARCGYCPRTAYSGEWINTHMDWETFVRLEPSFPQARMVHLQGWGEPLLHPRFFDMVARAKKAGCLVGATTNGTLIDPPTAREIVASGMDVLAFSLAGTGEDHDRWRQGTRLEQVLAAIKEVEAAKGRYRTDRPFLHVAYMLLRSGLERLKRLPDLLKGFGLRQVVITTLDFVPSEELAREAFLFCAPDELQYARVCLEEVRRKGGKQGLEVYYYLADRSCSRQLCTENVLRSVFVAGDGSVAPCVFACLPVREGVVYYTPSGSFAYEKMIFGNVHSLTLDVLWEEQAYADFRASFAAQRLRTRCQSCPKLYAVTP